MPHGRWMMIAVLAATASAGLGAGTVVIDLPQQGELGHVVQPAGHNVALQGFPVVWYRGQDDLADRDAWAIACMSDSSLRNSLSEDLPGYVHSGGGLVYLISSSSAQLTRDEDFLDRFDIYLRQRDADADRLRTAHHEITEGVHDLGDAPVPIHMYSSNQTALIRQSSRAVAIAREFGQGRIVVLPIDALSTRRGKDNPEQDKVQLLARAISWAAQARQKTADKATVYAEGPEREHYEDKESYKHRREPLEKLPQPEDFETDTVKPGADEKDVPLPELPAGPVELADTCLVDGGGEKDGWPQIQELLQRILPAAGLQIERVPEPREDEERQDNDYLNGGPLLRAMPHQPSLLVLFSWRRYSWEEARAVADHVRNGGSLLALASTKPQRQWRMRYFNRILEEFGVAASLTRPSGPGRFADAAFTEGVGVPEIPSGIGIWSFDDIELVRAGDVTVASIVLSGEGRVFVMDAKTLWSDEERVRDEFTGLLQNAVDWLIGTE